MQNIYDYQQLTKAIREGRMLPERSREYWGDDEREKLITLYSSGIGISQIALELQRSEMAVIQRLITEDLLTPPGSARKRSVRCVQDHISQEGWTPEAASSLWTKAADPTEEWPQWGQPVGAHDAYNAGDKVSHNEKHWISTTSGNVWEPGVYGWEEVTDGV